MAYEVNTIEEGPYALMLKEVAQPLTFPLTEADQAHVEVLKSMMLSLNAVGLAAPQIGIAKQIIAYVITDEQKQLRSDGAESVPPTVLINPSYQAAPDATPVSDWEACFSVKTISGKVPRFNKIIYTAYTPSGERIEAQASGFQARVLQHEIDHIHGQLIIDRLTPDCVQGHPNDMMPLRYQEFTAEQKAIVHQMLESRLQKLAPGNEEEIIAIKNLQRFLK